ncbi:MULTISPECIES: hypothetical protein [Paraburkholderia]|uniref:hypothetical protein n=1 Tax=Paraburkholderia TaxID=1822464 RepID=UPI0013EC2566|nr:MULTISPECIES: hypothetical protein [Paraburkholderia]MDR8399692.1 hypothetical protein [Paraburkholderia sp. USG1]
MKFSICLAVAALTVAVGAYAQTSQTFRFGEGQSALPSGNTRPAPAPHAQAQEPAAEPPAEQHAPPSKTSSKHKAKHRRHHRAHVTQPDTYSHN